MTDYKKKHAKFLASLYQNPSFKDWVDDIESDCPRIPSFDPKGENDENAWAYYSGLEEGYKLALSHLGVKLDE